MARMRDPNIIFVAQAGRLAAEALLFAASLRAASPNYSGRLFAAEPSPGPLWPEDPRINDADTYAALDRLGVEILPFENRFFGASYPNANKIEALACLPAEPVVFFDSDTLITGNLADLDFDAARPSASMARTGTWPVPELYGPNYEQIWASLYALFGLDFSSSQDISQPADHWERFLYFNAGWFTAPDPQAFANRMLPMMTAIRDTPPPELICQEIYPWLDQIALPLTLHALGGGRPGKNLDDLDGACSWHYQSLATIYARGTDATVDFLGDVTAPNWIKKVLKRHPPFHRLIYRGDGLRVRKSLKERAPALSDEKLRKRLRRMKLWLR